MKKLYSLFLIVLLSQFSIAQAPAGYYNGTTGLTGPALKTKLFQIISTGTTDNGYGGLWTAYPTTDLDNFYENDGTILDIYSENPNGADPYNFTVTTNQCGTYSTEGNCYNREHIVPQSLFAQASPMRNDIHFIRPTDGKVNAERSNYPFGKVGTATFTSQNGSKVGNSISTGYGGTVFEPINAFKGDVARMIFYFVTRYESQLSTFSTGNLLGGSSFPGLQGWELQQLLVWNTQDPVSAEEISRNNASYAKQGNRNPFIDNAQYATDIWGAVVLDTQVPTMPTNLVASNPTSNSVDLNWTASTDNVGVTGYDVFVNGSYKTTIVSNSGTVSGLASSTPYTFYVVAKDLSGNSSPQSNVATATTLAGTGGGGGTSCGTENFENIPVDPNTYGTRTWTNNMITWTATDARTDQTINTKAITIRNGTLTSSTISGGVQSVTVTTQLKFSGTAGTFNLRVNGNIVGSIPYNGDATTLTTTINGINVPNNVIFTLTDNSTPTNRVAFDDFSWVCSALSTVESNVATQIQIYPNPVTNGILNVTGENLNKIESAAIYDATGKLIQKIDRPFIKSNRIILNKVPAGMYILKTSGFSAKFLVK